MNSPIEVLRHWWEYYRERPFLRLARIFVERIFRGGGDTDSEGVDLGVGLVLTLLALPGGFISVLLFAKYSTLLSWMRGVPQTDSIAAAMPDEYFFITLSMAVTGGVAVWRWDALFPDRRDHANLVPLPVSTFTIFSANLAAVLFLAVLIACDVNGASSLLFPLGVGATQTSFVFFLKFAAIHVLVVGLASLFAFLAVLALLGGLVTILPAQISRRVSPFVRTIVVMGFVVLLGTSYALPDFWLRTSGASSVGWVRWLPSCWFLGLDQALHGRTDPVISASASLALPALGLTIASAFIFYALGYRRYFLRIAEMAETVSVMGREPSRLVAWFDDWILRTPFQKGCFYFVWRTLFRSEAHRLAMAGIFGMGIVLSSQFLARTAQATASHEAPSTDALAVPFALAFFVIVGLRVIFEIPADLRSNWIFRFTLDADHHECAALARTVMLTFVLPLLGLVAFPLYIYFDGWLIASLHTLLAATWSLLLANAVLIRFRKLPFTCPLPAFQQHSIVILFGLGMGFFVFAIATPETEARALATPMWMLAFIPVAALFWYIPQRMKKGVAETERGLVFEEVPRRAVELLQLGD
ncbi:MAG: hypothetical protein ACRD3B_02125 [Candidatus Sulfotelmatobacter sp.]